MSDYNVMSEHEYMIDLCKRLKSVPDKIKDIYGYSFVSPCWSDIGNIINECIMYIQETNGARYNMSVELNKLKEIYNKGSQ